MITREHYIWIPRKEWTKEPTHGNNDPNKHEGFVHYTDGRGKVRGRGIPEMAEAMRAYWHLHVKVNGWADIGYHAVIFQPWYRAKPVIFEGRGLDLRPAAQLGHNTGTVAISVEASPDENLLRRTEFAIAHWFRDYSPHSVKTIGGHRDVTSTSCPGDRIYRRIPEIARLAGKKHR